MIVSGSVGICLESCCFGRLQTEDRGLRHLEASKPFFFFGCLESAKRTAGFSELVGERGIITTPGVAGHRSLLRKNRSIVFSLPLHHLSSCRGQLKFIERGMPAMAVAAFFLSEGIGVYVVSALGVVSVMSCLQEM